MLTTAYIGVGSNLGNREETIEKAKEALSAFPQIRFIRSAPIYETQPIGGPKQGLYLNTVWELETTLDAEELLRVLSEIELHLGRTRAEKNGPRTLDLDLLLFGDEIVRQENLVIPHPQMQERWFVLKPLWDLRSDLIHPVFKKSVCELLDEVKK